MYKAKIVKLASVPAAEKAIRKIDVSEDCVRIMRHKAIFRVVKLHNVRNAVANILKQDMLSIGGDATVSQWSIGCTRPKTDVLLMGTLKHFRHVIAKARVQGAHLPPGKKSEYKAVSEELSRLLRKDLQ